MRMTQVINVLVLQDGQASVVKFQTPVLAIRVTTAEFAEAWERVLYALVEWDTSDKDVRLSLSVTQVTHVAMEARVGSVIWMVTDVTVIAGGLGNIVRFHRTHPIIECDVKFGGSIRRRNSAISRNSQKFYKSWGFNCGNQNLLLERVETSIVIRRY